MLTVARHETIVLAHHQHLVLRGLVDLFGTHPKFKVVARCSDSASCLEAMRDLAPDVALVGMTIPDLGGIELLRVRQAENMTVPVVLLAASSDRERAELALAEGACGVVSMETRPGALLHYLRAVAMGRSSAQLDLPDAAIEDQNPVASGKAFTSLLTERERVVARLAAYGLSNKQIGGRLGLCEGTVKVHLQHIFRKLAVSNRTALAALAFSHDIPLKREHEVLDSLH